MQQRGKQMINELVIQLSMIYKKDIYEFLEIESNAAEGKAND